MARRAPPSCALLNKTREVLRALRRLEGRWLTAVRGILRQLI